MNPHSLMGIITSVVLLIPVIVMGILRLFPHRSFLALSTYYLLMSVQNLLRQNVTDLPKSVYQSLGLVNNLLDAPLMLLFLVFFSTSALRTKRIMTTLFIFLGFEVVILSVFGFNVTSIKIVLAPDITLIIIISFSFFLRNVRLSVTNSKSIGKAVMITAVLLSYIIFSLVYIFYYLMDNIQYHEDAELIYFMVNILSVLLMSAGIVIENKRIKKLDDLKNTRKELATIYGEKKVVAFNKDGHLPASRRF